VLRNETQLEAGSTDEPAATDPRGLFALLGALADSGADLAHNTAKMAASEGRIVLHRVSVRLGLFVAGAFVAAVGLLLVLAGVTLVLARVCGAEPWLAFVVMGAVTLTAGAVFSLRAMRRLSAPDLAFPATLAEFDADIRSLRRRSDGTAGDTP
jgi:putative superfamily III holin-X